MKRVRLNENRLKQIIRESVIRTINETNFERTSYEFEKAIDALDRITGNPDLPEELQQEVQDVKNKLARWTDHHDPEYDQRGLAGLADQY